MICVTKPEEYSYGCPFGVLCRFPKTYTYKLGFPGQRPSSSLMLKRILNFGFLEWLDQFIPIGSSKYSIIYSYYSQIITKYEMQYKECTKIKNKTRMVSKGIIKDLLR